MDINKLIRWIDNVINEDGDKMHYGSLRTLGDIKKELRNSLNTVERNDSGGVAGGLGTANSAITPCAHEWILIEGNPVVVNTDICVKCHAIKTHTAQ